MTDWLAKKANLLAKFNQNHDDIGRFSDADGNSTGDGNSGDGGGGKKSGGKKKRVVSSPKGVNLKGKMGTKDNPHVTKNLKEAAQHLANGDHVRLESVAQVSTLLDELRVMTDKAKEMGDDAPNFNLCKVSVPGANLFCAENKGIPRAKMPQLKGIAKKGSKASKLPTDKDGEVNGGEAFVKHMKSGGVKVTNEKVKASHLKASQSELVGKKVAGMLGAFSAGKFDPSKGAIFVSKDNYVIDGHHRWAATIGMDASDGKLGDIMMNIIRVDMSITEVLRAANEFSNDFGIAPKVAKAAPKCIGCN